jgi:hypothetical protein
MALLMTVSGFVRYITFTVTVKGVPAVASAGAVKERIACVVAQPREINVALTINSGAIYRMGRAPEPCFRDCSPILMQTRITGFAEQKNILDLRQIQKLTVRLFFIMMAGLSQADIDSKHRSVNIDAVIVKLWFRQVSIGDVHVIHAGG